MSKKIGFIGLGIMGKPMARNLLKAGYALNVYSRSRPPMEELKRDGATLGTSPKDVAQASEVLITMLPNSPDVEEVVLGANGVLEGAKSGTILADMSTISPLVSQKIFEAAKKKRGSRPWMLRLAGGRKGPSRGSFPSWSAEIQRFMKLPSPSSRSWERQSRTWDLPERVGLRSWPIR